MELLPPGPQLTRVEDLSVMTLPAFWFAPLANWLDDTCLGEMPATAASLCGAAAPIGDAGSATVLAPAAAAVESATTGLRAVEPRTGEATEATMLDVSSAPKQMEVLPPGP